MPSPIMNVAAVGTPLFEVNEVSLFVPTATLLPMAVVLMKPLVQATGLLALHQHGGQNQTHQQNSQPHLHLKEDDEAGFMDT